MAKVNEIVKAAEADGTLLRLSRRFFARDYIAEAARYDIDEIEQEAK
jgi:hypothetical protein